ncbi:synaptotagmin-like protein 2 isoform X2 [Salarias fasciatus]|uniref:synaptotagmin-like protein 2 isoform X2 n=1 Tax=Salarias fasciatus TaxID=181472 RepID=UPI001176D253|nr:synaptotagmin-like protein 2 isoform X2 [Salarias fasciatus]
MIDLSHLTEEEQEVIMTVLRRDAELKKAEEERVRKLEKILSGGPQTDSKLKYLTGEWFYEAKSQRHSDKIHGSEIILASMRQGRAASLDGSLRVDRSRMSSSRGSDIVPPQKPARCFEAQQPKQRNDAEKENQDSSVCSPRLPRHNPFNRPSLIVVEPPENSSDLSTSRDPETAPVSPLKSRPACEASQAEASVTPDASSVAFRPVPKKRTFLARRTEGTCSGADAPGGSAAVVPAPRRSLQQASSGSSESSRPKSREEMPPKAAAPLPDGIPQPVQPSRPAGGRPAQPPRHASQVSSNSSLERPRLTASEKTDRPAVFTRSSSSIERKSQQRTEEEEEEEDSRTQREHPDLNLFREIGSRMDPAMTPAMTPEELSLPQSTVDPVPPISYDLHFIDQSDQCVQRPGQTHVFKLSTQTSSPDGDEEDSIAKVLDWFSRSVDSSEWLNSDEGPEATKFSEVGSSRREEPSADTTGRKRESLMKRLTAEEEKDFRGSGRKGGKELIETQGKLKTSTGEGKVSQDGENSVDENQPPKISHLKSFWEKSNAGPKILVSKLVTPADKGQKPPEQPAEKASDILSAPRSHSERGTPGKITSSRSDEREQQLVINPRTDSLHLHDQKHADHPVTHSPQRRNNDVTYSSDYFILLNSPQAADRSSEMETPCVTKRSPGLKSANGLVAETTAPVRPFREEPSRIVPAAHLDANLQTRGSLDSEQAPLSRSSPYMDYKLSVNDVQIPTKAHIYSEATEERKRRDSEDKGTSHKAKDESLGKDRAHSPHSNRQESTAEKIKQLKSFWEQERSRPIVYTGKPKPSEDGKAARGANQAKLNKRFTKSEYDLRSLGNELDSDPEHTNKNHPNFTVVPLNQRLEKVSPSLSASRSQFNTLRDFWDDTTSDSKGLSPYDKPKSPKRKEPTAAQLPSLEAKGGETQVYRLASAAEKSRPPVTKSSPSHQIRPKSPHDRQTGTGPRVLSDGKSSQHVSAEQRQSRRGLKDSGREERPPKPQSSPRKDIRSPKRKDSFSMSSSRGNSLRRATSMFSLSAPDDADQSQLRIDVSPVHSHSRKQRQGADKGSASREEALTPPLARAFVPTDYRHYLGMTDRTSVHTSLAPAAEDEGSEGKSGYEPGPGGLVRASTPVSGEERHGWRDGRAGQRPLWATYSSSDTGQESSLSSTSESWSSSRKNRENDDEQNPVKKALWRAEIRPKNLAKSMEDITGPLSPRQERRPDPTSELRRISDVSSIPSPSSSLFSDSDYLKEMSKSVPSFLQNELSGSVMTMYSADFGNVEVQGHIQFSINYIQRLREFHIFVAECGDLAAVEPKRGRSDPYVKSYLVPDKANLGKRKTSVKKKTLNPTFNEILRYRVRLEYLRTQTLILSVWHHDTFGRNSFLGEVDVDLSKWDFDHTQMNYLALKARATPTLAPSSGQGEMRVAIRFLPQIIHSEGKEGHNTGEIHIWVKECKNLPLIRATIDPYVKCFVLPDTSRKSRQKTRVLRRTVDPVFNHTMVYDGIRNVDLTEACVELTVWDRDRLASNLLGGLRLGAGTGRSYGAAVDWMDSSPYEVALWERMIASPNEWVEDVLPLRVLNSAKTAFM